MRRTEGALGRREMASGIASAASAMASTSAVKLEHVQEGAAGAASGSMLPSTSSVLTSPRHASRSASREGGDRHPPAPARANSQFNIPEEDAHLLATLGHEGPRSSTLFDMPSKRQAFEGDGALPSTSPKPGTGMDLDLYATGMGMGAGGQQQQHMDANQDGPISAYAKLEFPGFSYYIQTLDVLIGRRPGNAAAGSPPAFEAGGDGMKQITGGRQEGHVDVDLGPMKSISRHHARIFYNPPGVPIPGDLSGYRGPAVPTEGTFVLEVLGRNGTFVDDVYLEKGHCVPLSKR